MKDFQPTADFLANKTLLITGANSGIGAELAKQCASFGATVILVARNNKRLEAVYDEIIAQGGPEPVITSFDLGKAQPEDYQRLSQLIDDEFGQLDGLIHCAAIAGGLTPIANYPIDRWYQVIHTDLTAPCILTQSLLPLLRKSANAHIIFTIDQVSEAYWGAYGIAKAGLKQLANLLAQELEANTQISVNCVDPGPTATRFRSRLFPGEVADSLPKPEQQLAPYIYVLSQIGQKINGEILQPERQTEKPLI